MNHPNKCQCLLKEILIDRVLMPLLEHPIMYSLVVRKDICHK